MMLYIISEKSIIVEYNKMLVQRQYAKNVPNEKMAILN